MWKFTVGVNAGFVHPSAEGTSPEFVHVFEKPFGPSEVTLGRTGVTRPPWIPRPIEVTLAGTPGAGPRPGPCDVTDAGTP